PRGRGAQRAHEGVRAPLGARLRAAALGEARRPRSRRQAVSVAREFRAERRRERSSVFASLRLRASSPAAPLLMLVASCASAPSEEPAPERESGAESPAQAITPQAAPEPAAAPGVRGPFTEELTL